MNDDRKLPRAAFIQGRKDSEWTCYLFGNNPTVNNGIVWNPAEGCVPNAFVRWMMKICFACTWIRKAQEK